MTTQNVAHILNRTAFCFGLAFAVLWNSCALADLTAGEVAVIANSSRPQSMELARSYMKARNIPEGNLCPIPFADAAELSRTTWSDSVRPKIREWLELNDPKNRIRCLVTVWGVPLVIGPDMTPPANDPYRQFLELEREFRLKNTKNLFRQITELGVDPGAEVAAGDEFESLIELKELETRFQQIAREAQVRIAEKNNDPMLVRAFEQMLLLVGGNSVILNAVTQSVKLAGPVATDEQLRQQSLYTGRIEMARDALSILDLLPPSIERDTAIMAVIERAEGILGTIFWIDRELASTALNETSAALDSELSLVRWESGYRLHRWLPNYSRAGMEQLQLSKKYPVMMVARLDGATAAAAMKLVEGALEAERQGGLAGTFYLDARGIGEGGNLQELSPVIQQMEQSLLTAGGMVQKAESMPVVADTRPVLFQPEDNCIGAAIYCGWYSLGKYVDAFEFVPGAIAYHLSTIEAVGLRGNVAGTDPAVTGWCSGLLGDGVAVTIGAVGESGQAALPLPHDFIGKLFREHMTVGESYWQSVPNTSWNMILIGDPLYRPFPQKAGK